MNEIAHNGRERDINPLQCSSRDEAKKILGVQSRTEAVHLALTKPVSLSRFKALMRNNAGKLSFAALSK
jgi:hypothetical protein